MTSIAMPIMTPVFSTGCNNQRQIQHNYTDILCEGFLYDEQTMTMKQQYSIRFSRDRDGVWCKFVKENNRSTGFMDLFRWGDSEFLVTEIRTEMVRVLNGFSGLVEDKLAMRVFVPGRSEHSCPVFVLEDDVRDTVGPVANILEWSKKYNPDYEYQRRSRRGGRHCC